MADHQVGQAFFGRRLALRRPFGDLAYQRAEQELCFDREQDQEDEGGEEHEHTDRTDPAVRPAVMCDG